MDTYTLSNVTNLFFTTKKNGTGFGTSLSKEIMELHGGSIKYDSSLGVGTKVVLAFPLDKTKLEVTSDILNESHLTV